MSNFKRLFFSMLMLVVTTGVASASSFRAADIVYLPAVARLQGAGGAFFKTDVVVSNVSDQRVIVSVAYGVSGADNRTITSGMKTLPVLLPGERRDIADIVETLQLGTVDANNVRTANGFLIFFACREGATCADCDANPADCQLITVQGRIYNQPAGETRTFGQLFPGIPWYNYVSVDSQSNGLHRVFIPGLRNAGTAGVSGFRSNIGLVNASQTSSTRLRVTIFSPTGTQLGQQSFDLPPLGHTQFNAAGIGLTGDGWALIEQTAVTPTGSDPANPGFMAYGSLIDNISGDPTTLEAQYYVELPFDCVYGSKPKKRMVKRG